VIVTINDLPQFFRFSQLQHCLIHIIEQNNQISDELLISLKNTKSLVSKAINNNSIIKTFCTKYCLNIIDLDLLQIALMEQKRTITLEKYFEKSIFEKNDKTLSPQIIKKLAKSTLIKQGYLTIENPFQESNNKKGSKTVKKNSIIKLLNSPLAVKKSKEHFLLEFEPHHYSDFNQILKDIQLLDRIINTDRDQRRGLTQDNFHYLYKAQLKKIKRGYRCSLKNKDNKFSTFLLDNKLDLDDFILILKYFTRRMDFDHDTLQISPELFDKFKNEKSFEKLIKNDLLTQEKHWIELSEKTLKGLSEINSDNSSENLVLFESPQESFDQICLTSEVKKQILNVITQFKNKDIIFKDWGLGKSIGYGKGITINLSGPPGTGKTLSARAIANYLGKQLLTINYSELESMWVGGTEKNISKSFDTAKKNNAVLFFDEADSLTTKRENSQVSWEITRTNTLLKELETFEGICIFATNFASNYDEAFNRRLSAHIEFKLPDVKQLGTILNIHFPKKEALHNNVDFVEIARIGEGIFSGGDVKNVVLNAARIAANDSQNKIKKICQEHLIEACEVVSNGKIKSGSEPYPELCYLG